MKTTTNLFKFIRLCGMAMLVLSIGQAAYADWGIKVRIPKAQDIFPDGIIPRHQTPSRITTPPSAPPKVEPRIVTKPYIDSRGGVWTGSGSGGKRGDYIRFGKSNGAKLKYVGKKAYYSYKNRWGEDRRRASRHDRKDPPSAKVSVHPPQNSAPMYHTGYTLVGRWRTDSGLIVDFDHQSLSIPGKRAAYRLVQGHQANENLLIVQEQFGASHWRVVWHGPNVHYEIGPDNRPIRFTRVSH